MTLTFVNVPVWLPSLDDAHGGAGRRRQAGQVQRQGRVAAQGQLQGAAARLSWSVLIPAGVFAGSLDGQGAVAEIGRGRRSGCRCW